jgi:hypothetical protein
MGVIVKGDNPGGYWDLQALIERCLHQQGPFSNELIKFTRTSLTTNKLKLA